MCSATEVWGRGVSNAQELPWKRLRAEELLKRARALRHSAAGPDGWSSDEILAIESLETLYAQFPQSWFERGVFPRAWREMNPSSKALHVISPRSDGWWWKAFCGGLLRVRGRKESWMLSWLPDQAHGAVPGRWFLCLEAVSRGCRCSSS